MALVLAPMMALMTGLGGLAAQTPAADRIDGLHGESPLSGTECLRFITPQILELARTTTKARGENPISWNFVTAGVFTPPDPASYTVTVNGQTVATSFKGSRRRVAHAPLAKYDLHIDNRVFLQLATPAQAGDVVVVTTTGWGSGSQAVLTATLASDRRNPAIHVNQVGYPASGPKQAMAGYFLGSGGELDIPPAAFRVVETTSGATALTGVLTARPDQGFDCTPLPYQKVMAADFSALETAGSYQLEIDGLGRSLSFRIDPDMTLNFARMYAQGLYNQRCGTALTLPFSRHTHGACHTAAAAIPTGGAEFQDTWTDLAAANSDSPAANRMTSVDTQLYPILRSGTIDVAGGHHDAGDYSKYTINSAQLIHHLAFAADNFPGAGSLDNLGIPESGNGKSDLLDEAKQEADFLAKLQDDDGGFFFLVYPKHRKYENNVLPDQGDPQVVWPKNTASTAAAVGALADIGSSPLFQQQFPAEAAIYLQKARAGWNFLLTAIQNHGKAGSYQTITHYGDLFSHDDELAWAAAAMFAATGDPLCQQKFIEWYNPQAQETIRWGWWYLFEGYGCAARSYSFAISSGRRTAAEVDPLQLGKTRAIIKTAGDAIAGRTLRNAYATCLDDASKRQMTAGWFFSGDRAFDLTAHNALEARPDWQSLVLGNTNFELGCNPLNVSFVTGAGQRQQHEIVHQYAQNDLREMPPSGLPLGNLQAGFPWTNLYESGLNQMNYPFDWETGKQYPLYDRWGDTFNTTTEFVIANQARELASMCALAATAPGAATPWQTATATIVCPDGFLPQNQAVTFRIEAGTLDLTNARVVWETPQECHIGGPSFEMTPGQAGTIWVEAEAVLPDGKRISARKEVGIQAAHGGAAFPLEAATVALYHFDGGFDDASPNAFHLAKTGNVTLDPLATGWMAQPAGSAVRFHGIGDTLKVQLPDNRVSPGASATAITVEAWIHPLVYKSYGLSNEPLLNLSQAWNSQFGIQQDMWIQPNNPFIKADGISLLDTTGWSNLIQMGTWQLLSVSRDAGGNYAVKLNGQTVATASGTSGNYSETANWSLTLGNFDGYLDELRITASIPETTPAAGGGGTGGTGTGTGGQAAGTQPAATTVQPFLREFAADAGTVALYHFNGDFLDDSGNQFDLTASPGVTFVPTTHADGTPAGQAARFRNFGDTLSTLIPDAWLAPGSSSQELTVEAWIWPRAYKAYGVDVANILWLYQHWDSSLGVMQDKWLLPDVPMLRSGASTITSNSQWPAAVTLGQWQKITITRDTSGNVGFRVNDTLVSSAPAPIGYDRTNAWTLILGNIDADIDEVRISRTTAPAPPPEGFINDADTIALYHFDGGFQDSSGNNHHLLAGGNARLQANPGWMSHPSGHSAAFTRIGDKLTVTLPNAEVSPATGPDDLCIEARILATSFLGYGWDGVSILMLYQYWDCSLGVFQDKWLLPAAPLVLTGSHAVLSNSAWNSGIQTGVWHNLKITRHSDCSVQVEVDGIPLSNSPSPVNTGRTDNWQLELGNFTGEIDELRISRVPR